MIKRSLLLVSAISLAFASDASTVRVDLYQPTVINGTTFKAGEAKLEVQGGKAILRQGKTSAETAVTVETSKDKYRLTTVGYKDPQHIKDICVGGTTTHILFEAPTKAVE